MRAADVLAVTGLVLAAPAAAYANRAFAAAEAVLVPADSPQEIVLVTSLGVVLPQDGGATWRIQRHRRCAGHRR